MNILQKTRLSKYEVIMLIIMASVFMTGCTLSAGNGEDEPQSSVNGIYFDTFVSISAYDDTPAEVLKGAIGECEKYEKIFSRTDEESQLYSINNRSAGGAICISKDMRRVIAAGLEYGKMTEGRFDIAIGAVTKQWDFHSDGCVVPDGKTIEDALKHTDATAISQNDSGLFIDDDKLEMDLGGIAKGYIADRLKEYLTENGCTEAVIALGGNIVCIGDKRGQGYSVGVKTPFDNTGKLSKVLNVSDTSVVTSGVYERYFEKDGQMYHHILDPATGYPARTDLYSVTIVCDDSMKADALTTAVLIMGEKEGIEYIRERMKDEVSPVKQAVLINDRYSVTEIN